MGDGECNEGAVWEAALFASSKKLNNLYAIVDFNNWQGIGRTKDILQLHPFKKKWESFGWLVREVDGHNLEEIHNSLNDKPEDKPLAIVANTIKGKGISFMENEVVWHHKVPTEEQYNLALNELEELKINIEND